MPSGPKAPAPMNVGQVTQQGQAANLTAAQQGQALTTMPQNNPYTSLSYTTTIDPITGLPKYTSNLSYSPEQQALLNTLQGTQQQTGTAGATLASNVLPQYETAPDLVGGANSLTMQALEPNLAAWERFNAPARAQLDTALRTQGILPSTNPSTSDAYQQQMDKLTQQQQLNEGQWLANFMPQAFDMAKTQYQLPLENLSTFMKMGAPVAPNTGIMNTPGANVAPVNVPQIAEAAWDQQFKAYQQEQARRNALMGMGLQVGTAAMGMPVNPFGAAMGL